MNTGQMLTVIGALVLLSFASLAIKWMLIDKTASFLESEAQIVAISLAQSMIDEIETKSFDLATYGIPGTVYDSSQFTGPADLGPSSSESGAVPLPDTTRPNATYPYKSIQGYNDVDDYHKYRRIVSTSRMGKFTLRDSVFYVRQSDPDQLASTETFFKKIIVTVTHPSMLKPLTLSDIVVYRAYY